jgi:hypothetical protein
LYSVVAEELKAGRPERSGRNEFPPHERKAKTLQRLPSGPQLRGKFAGESLPRQLADADRRIRLIFQLDVTDGGELSNGVKCRAGCACGLPTYPATTGGLGDE